MHAPFHRRYRLLSLLIALVVFALYATPVPQARAQTAGPDWIAWDLKVDFPNNTTRAILTLYEGVDGEDNKPAVVTDDDQYDISANCQSYGGLTLAGEAASFAGNGYIRCRLPAAVAALPDKCTARMGPFYWFASKVAIGPNAQSSPIAELTTPGGNPAARFSVVQSGTTGQTELIFPGVSYLSAPWDIATGDNRILLGSNGPSIVSIADHFADDDWLGFMTAPDWQNYMQGVSVHKVANWAEPQMIGWQTNRSLERWPNTRFVYIGHSPSAGTYFSGTLWDLEIDPGCTAH